MLKVYTNQNMTMVGVVKAALENQNIECQVKNANLSGALGEIPFTETWPELWIVKDDQKIKADAIVQRIMQDSAPQSKAWECPSCGEKIEGYFNQCWKCGASQEQ